MTPRRLPTSRRSVAATLAISLGVAGAVVVAAPAHAAPPFPIDDPFAGSKPGTTMPDGWARLGTDTKQAAIVDAGTAGKWLRLTDNQSNRSGAVFSTKPYQATQGLSIEFDMRMYNSSDNGYADGMSFFLQDASVPLDRLGPDGGALGYWSPEHACSAGMPGGVLGVGFDRFGNYTSGIRNAITLRGAAGSCYKAIESTGDKGTSFLETRATTPAKAPYRHVKLDVLPSEGGKARVQLSMSAKTAVTASPGALTKYLDTSIDIASLPSQLRLGFAGSTGTYSEYHEVRGITASQPLDIGVTASVVGKDTDVLPGDDVTVRMTATNHGSATIGGAPDARARLVAELGALHLEGVSWSCEESGGATCTTKSGTGDVLVDWTGPNGSSVTVTATGKLAADAPVGEITGRAATVTDFAANTFDPSSHQVTLDGSALDTDLANNTVPLAITAGLEEARMTDDATTTAQGAPVTVDVLENDTIDRTGIDRSSLVLTTTGLPGATLSDGGKQLVVPGEATYRITADADVTVTPVATFFGPAKAVTYQATSNGGQSATAALRVRVEGGPVSATDDVASTPQGTAVDIDVLANDEADTSGFDTASVRLDGATDDGRELVVDGEGTYRVRTDGTVRFTPDVRFIGTATAVGYSVRTQAGQSADAEIRVDVSAARVTAADDRATTAQGAPTTVDVLANDTADPSGFDRRSVAFTSSGTKSKTKKTTISKSGDSMTVPGQGTYTITEDGAIRFAPVDTFVGTAKAVRYQARTNAGQTVAADLRVDVTPGAVRAADDQQTTVQAEAVSVDVLANDTADPSGFDRGSLVLQEPDVSGAALSDGGKELVVPTQGRYVVDGDGGIRFTPVATFIGTTTPVTYDVATNAGQHVTATLTVVVDAGAVSGSDDRGETTQGKPVSVDVMDNDRADASGFDAGSVRIDGALPDGTLEVAGQGSYSVTDEGAIRFTPVDTFIGTTRAVSYTVDTKAGQHVSAKLTVAVSAASVSASDDDETTAQAESVTIDVLANDEADPSGFDASTIRLSSDVDGAVLEGGTVTVPGQGTWSTVDGRVRFVPVATFIGEADRVHYDVATKAGQHVGADVSVSVAAGSVDASADRTSTAQARSVSLDVLANDTADPSGFDAGSVRLVGAGADGAVEQDGVGRWTVSADGGLSFEPVVTFIGTTPAVTYEARTNAGQRVSSTATVVVDAAPVRAGDDTATTGQADAVRIDVLANDLADPSGFDPSTLRVHGAGGERGPSGTGRDVSVPGEGVWRVVDGGVEFVPDATLIGTTKGASYSVETHAGQRVRAAITVEVQAVPVAASPDETRTLQAEPVSLDVLGNDTADPSGFDAATLRLTADAIEGAKLSDDGRVLEVEHEGRWAASAAGLVFAPVATFIGTTTPVGYVAETRAGQRTGSTATVEVEPVHPVATADRFTTLQGEPVRFDVLANDQADPSGWDTATLGVVGHGAGATPSRSLTTDDGTFTVGDGTIEFRPSASFVGTSAPVDYTLTTKAGQVATSSVTVDVHAVGPRAADDAVTTAFETPVTFSPAENDRPGVDGGTAVVPSSVRLVQRDGVAVDRLGMDEGTFEVAEGGAVRFTPAGGFTGSVPAVQYRVLDGAGAPGTATIRVTVEREALAFTGAEVGAVAAGSIALLLSGLILLVMRGRRREHGDDSV